MKITFFVLNLASNPIVRAWPLAQAAQELGYEVEVLGFLREGEEVYAPYRDKTEYKIIRINRFRDIFFRASDLAKLATGNLIYCCKPNLETMVPAMLASRFGWRKKLLLDAEDNELWTPEIPVAGHGLGRLRWWWLIRWKLLAHFLLKFCRYRATVSSRGLQARYGGEVILHGPDGDQFDPALPEHQSKLAKKVFGVDPQKISILFAGMPQKHKGLDLVVEAVRQLNDYALVLAGDPNWAGFRQANELLGERCRLIGMVKNEKMPQLLAAVDLVVVPQRLNDFTRFQMPAKLLEAMAMAKGVVVSNVSDLPQIVGEKDCSPRGWVCRHDDLTSLTATLELIAEEPDEIRVRGSKARSFFLEQASQQSIATQLRCLINQN